MSIKHSFYSNNYVTQENQLLQPCQTNIKTLTIFSPRCFINQWLQNFINNYYLWCHAKLANMCFLQSMVSKVNQSPKNKKACHSALSQLFGIWLYQFLTSIFTHFQPSYQKSIDSPAQSFHIIFIYLYYCCIFYLHCTCLNHLSPLSNTLF